MLMDERRYQIKNMLLTEGSVRVSELREKFNVSEETIRRDLAEMERYGFAKKNYGGAVLAESFRRPASWLTTDERCSRNLEEKDAIAKRAAQFVSQGETIMLDSGSTIWRLARLIKDIPALSVVTNNLYVVNECASSSWNLYVVGGKFLNDSMCMLGPTAGREIERYYTRVAFLACTGVSVRTGFSVYDLFEVETKAQMIASAERVIVLADHTKFHSPHILSFAQLSDVDILITSELTDASILKEIERTGVEVIVAPL